MSGWRPKRWAHNRSEYFEHNQSVKSHHKTRQKDYEAGADAIIEALKKEGEYLHNTGQSPYGYILGKSLKLGQKGWLVFIEEAKDDGKD